MEEGGHHSEQSSLQLYNLHDREVRRSGHENVLVYSISKYNVCNSVKTGQDQMTTLKMLCPSSQGTGDGYCILGYLRMSWMVHASELTS